MVLRYRVGSTVEKEGKAEAVGSGVHSHAVARAVPSALVSLTAGFEMEPGGPSPLWPPTTAALPSFSRLYSTDAARALLLTHSHTHASKYPPPRMTGVRPRPLVRVGFAHYCASTSRLSSWSSSSGLTWLSSGGSHLEAGFPLRCFQRFSAPEIATRLCHGRGNRHTSAPSIPVLSY